jgi:hypothetical protein
MQKRRIALALVAALSVALVLTACTGEKPGSTTDQSSTAPSDANNATAARATQAGSPAAHGPDACTLVSNDDLKRITGADYLPGMSGTGNTGKQCHWDPAARGGAAIDLAIRDAGRFSAPTGAEPVPGVGDAAWWNAGAKQFIAKKGDRVLIVAFSGASVDPKPWGQQIAAAAVQKL